MPLRPRRAGPVAWLLLTLSCLIASAPAATPGQWYSVHLDGRQVGHMHVEREVDGGHVLSRRHLELSIERNGERLHVVSRERFTETPTGEPLAFVSETDLAGSRSLTEGTIDSGVLRLRREPPGPSDEAQMPWPAGALLAEGQRLALLAATRTPGSELMVPGFEPASLRIQHTRWQWLGEREVDIHGTPETLLETRQVVVDDASDTNTDQHGIAIDAWLRPDDLSIRRMRIPVLGLALEVLACDRACALAPVQPADVLAGSLVDSPRALGERERSGALVYRLRLPADQANALARLPGQHGLDADADADGVGTSRLQVDPRGHGNQSPPTDADSQPTRWLQSDAAEIRAMARQAIGRARDPAAQMRRLEQRVRRHIGSKSLRVGYASALETLRSGEGDCTEHAVLLAALARAAGIPARVATGLAYTRTFNGRTDVFVPHAWVFAWVDGRWQGFDAALDGYDSGHLAFSVDHGDPFRFYRGLQLLSTLQIDAIDAAEGRL